MAGNRSLHRMLRPGTLLSDVATLQFAHEHCMFCRKSDSRNDAVFCVMRAGKHGFWPQANVLQ
jgi:hypothetical protein